MNEPVDSCVTCSSAAKKKLPLLLLDLRRKNAENVFLESYDLCLQKSSFIGGPYYPRFCCSIDCGKFSVMENLWTLISYHLCQF